jgi:hypothetical protein
MTRAPNQPYKIGADDVRPLGTTITVFEHEWLPSLFRRIGYFYGQPAVVIAHWCGLYDLPRTFRDRLPNVLHLKATAGIAAGLGCDPKMLQTTVMSHLAPGLVAIRPDGKPSQSHNWTRRDKVLRGLSRGTTRRLLHLLAHVVGLPLPEAPHTPSRRLPRVQ